MPDKDQVTIHKLQYHIQELEEVMPCGHPHCYWVDDGLGDPFCGMCFEEHQLKLYLFTHILGNKLAEAAETLAHSMGEDESRAKIYWEELHDIEVAIDNWRNNA